MRKTNLHLKDDTNEMYAVMKAETKKCTSISSMSEGVNLHEMIKFQAAYKSCWPQILDMGL